ncbi:Ig-like domain-containing protein, partial [Pseudomonas chlororaphis]|uniref:Ig-like domain-containing protein n=1 Tax=Pseudomonas chlororaphis TaxID=587753 RepID=UPI0018DEE83C
MTNVDKAGNVSEPSDAYVVIVDTAAPNKPSIDTVFDDQGDKQGNLIAGETTDDAKPAISGKAEAGSTVVIMDKGQEIGRAQANEAGEWTFTPATPLANGGHDLSVKAIDAAGNASEPSDNFDFNVIAGGAPAMPAITAVKDDIGSIQGNLQKNAVTDDSKPTIEGTAEAGATVSIYSNGNLLGTTVADAAGQWSFTPETELTDGLHNLTATATNLAGNISPSTGLYPITVDTQAPSADNAAELHDDVGQIQGVIKSGDTTDDNLPTLTGKAEGNATVVIYDNGQKIGQTTTDADGNWSFTPSTPLVDGAHNFVTEVIDQAGNVGEKSAGTDFIVDTRAVEISITKAVDDAGSKQGNLAKGDVTDDATPTLSGKATAGGIVKIYDGATLLGQTTADAQGNWSFTPAALADGLHNLTATVTTEAKGESEHTSIFDLTVDTTAPNKPGIDDAQDDVGAIQGSIGNGKHTDDTTPTLSGKGEPGSTVNIYDKGDLLGSATVGENGEWTFTPTSPLVDGEHSFTVTNVDKAGNVSEPSEAYVVIVDTNAPTQTATVTSMGKDSGFDSSDWLTNDGSAGRLLEGTLTAALAENESLLVSTDDGVTWVAADVSGTAWSVQDGITHEDNWVIQTRVVDAAGNLGPVSRHTVALDTEAPDAPASISVASGKVTVVFDASQMVAGDHINIISGGQRMDYELTEADITAGKATVTPTFTIGSDVVVAMVDIVGNISDYTGLTVGKTVTENFTSRATTSPIYTGASLVLNTMTVKVLQGQTFIGTYSNTAGFGVGQRLYFGYSGIAGDRLEISPTDACKTMSFTTDYVHNAATYEFYDTDGVLLKTLSFAGNASGYKVSFEAPEGKMIGKVVAYTDEWGFLDNFEFVTPAQTYDVGPLVEQDIAVDSSGVFRGGSEDNFFKLADVASLDKVQIEGNDGIDTLKLLGGGQTLELSALNDKISSVEIFDITGTGDNTLKLSLADVLENGAKNLFADDDNVQLMVKGDTGDRVELSDLLGVDGMDTGDWSEKDQLTSDGVVYHVYQHSGMAAEVLARMA